MIDREATLLLENIDDADLQAQLREVIESVKENQRVKIIQEFLALFPVQEQFDISSKLQISLGDVPLVEVGECTEENAETVVFETIPQQFSTPSFGFLNNLNDLNQQFWGSKSLNPTTLGEFAFSSKSIGLRGAIQVHWQDNHLTLSTASIQSPDNSTSFYNLIHEQPDAIMIHLQTAIEELSTYLKQLLKQAESPALSSHAWEYVWAKPKQRIEEDNQQKQIAQKQEEERMAPYRERAEALFRFFDTIVAELRPQLNSLLDSEVFANWEDKQESFRKNALRHLAGWLQYFPEDTTLDNQVLRDSITDFVKNAQIGHNRTEAFGEGPHTDTRVQKLSDGNARDLIEYLGMNPEQVYLSCVLVNPNSETTQKYGTGWTGDTCYLFSLEEFASQSLVFTGDVDQATHEGFVESRTMLVKDALLISALLTYKNEILEKTKTNRHYDELLFFRKVDFQKDSLDKITLTTSTDQ